MPDTVTADPPYGRAQIAKGNRYADFVMPLVSPYGLTFWLSHSPLFQVNVGENTQGVEVKNDNRCTDTKRLSIEVAEKSNKDKEAWTASGILSPDNAWCYIQGNYEMIFVFSKKWLLRYYREKRPEVTVYIDPINNGACKRFFLPFAIAEPAAMFVLDGKGRRIDDRHGQIDVDGVERA